MADLAFAPSDFHRSVVEHAPFGIYRATPSGKILAANPAFTRLLGYSSEEDVRRLDLDADVYVRPGERRRMLEAHDFGPFDRAAVPWMRADGEEIVVRVSGRPVFGDGTEPRYFDVFVEDVTERHRKRGHVDRALESSGAFLFTLVPDEEGPFPLRPAWVNEAVTRTLGYSRE